MITKILVVLGVTLLTLIVLAGCLGFITLMIGVFRAFKKRREIARGEDDNVIRQYFKLYDSDHKLAIIDATPRPVVIGSGKTAKTFLLKPLKYRQVTKLCIMFAKILEKLHNEKLDLSQADMVIGKLVELCEDDFFRGLAFILYFSEHAKEDDDKKVALGVEKLFVYIKDNAELSQLTRCLEIIIMQNDVERALNSFGRLAIKKKFVE